MCPTSVAIAGSAGAGTVMARKQTLKHSILSSFLLRNAITDEGTAFGLGYFLDGNSNFERWLPDFDHEWRK
jgi:hypothetical protein